MKTLKISILNLVAAFVLMVGSCSCNKQQVFDQTVFYDDFSSFETGIISPAVGPHTEYHFLKEAQLTGNWKVTSFYFSPRGADTAWRIEMNDGKKAMFQSINNTLKFTHPMITGGNPLWQDYAATVDFTPVDSGRVGLIFLYHNDRQYYFLGFDKNNLSIIKVNHETAFHTPNETILATKPIAKEQGKRYSLRAETEGDMIKAYLNGELLFSVSDSTFSKGKIALMADVPAYFHSVKVETSPSEINRIKSEELQILSEEKAIQDANPKPVLWKKIATKGFGVGRNLRFGDLNNDGQTDVLIGQVVHHAFPRDSYSELSCLTAMTFDGEVLWQNGTPSRDHESLTNDVAFQIYDLDSDGRNEVIYTMNCELIVADAATGKTKFKRPTPQHESIQYANDSREVVVKKWDKILGDCLFICNLRGLGHPSDILIKDRYSTFWILDENLKTQWSASCRTGHYPYAKDIDGDGKEELFMGYTVYNWKGEKLWSLDDKIEDHSDGVAVVNFGQTKDSPLKVFNAASDQGAVVADTKGNIEKIHYVGHVQNPAIANFRDDLPGLETVSVNFWGNQGIIHLYDSSHNIYHDFEPTSYGSMCLPINWNGTSEELFVLNANIIEGGMYDGWGRKAVRFPDDGHPDMCNVVLNLTGDVRDEVVVWNPEEIWVYTQSDSPLQGNLYKTKKNPLYNYSNYQLTVSEPEQ